ncbi:hypothetical protein HY380_02260 [Candidatus Saccharibacteria bacterium]|nr:hypothetical protein [Candidatus Saccharibacteria bacterium]
MKAQTDRSMVIGTVIGWPIAVAGGLFVVLGWAAIKLLIACVRLKDES